jgi:hypothetical protein
LLVVAEWEVLSTVLVVEWEVLPTVLLLLEEVVCDLGLAKEMVAVEVQASRATFRPRQDQLPLVVGVLAMVLLEQEEFAQVSASGLVQVEEAGTPKSVVAVYTPSLLSEVGDAVQSHQILDLAFEIHSMPSRVRDQLPSVLDLLVNTDCPLPPSEAGTDRQEASLGRTDSVHRSAVRWEEEKPLCDSLQSVEGEAAVAVGGLSGVDL